MTIPNNLAKYFDHTNLKADCREKEIKKLCAEAKEHGFYSVCVNPAWVKSCARWLKESGVKVCTVIGFPLGANRNLIKASEIKRAIADGAEEVDMVINISKLKDKKISYIKDELTRCKKAAGDKVLKVIIETCFLTDAEKETAVKLCVDAGCDFVKTSTGFGSGGATVEDIQLMKRIGGSSIRIKASGGIKTLESTLNLIEAGANRIGSSGSVTILKEALKI
jgi:deoxyribose-phosphate aldolase